MIPPEVLHRKSLFSLLYKIDQDLAERTRARHCPFVGVRCIAPITGENLGVGPLIFARLSRCASACAAVVTAAAAGCYRHRFGSGTAGFTGRLWFFWSPPFVKKKVPRSPWNGSSRFAGCGDRRSNAGSATFKIFSPKVTDTGAWVDTYYPGSLRNSCPENLSPVFTEFLKIPRQL